MFDPSKIAKEIFNTLRSFDYTVHIFDYDGNRVYEPSDARRFFATPNNITVSILEDGENSSVKLFLSDSVDPESIIGLVNTLRTMSSKYGVLFNVRKYNRELKPRDLAPNAIAESQNGETMTQPTSTTTTGTVPPVAGPTPNAATTAAPPAPMAPMAPAAPTAGAQPVPGAPATDPTSDVGTLNPIQAECVEEDLTEARGEDMIELPALGCSVELSAWNAFKDHDEIALYGQPEQFSDEQIGQTGNIKVLKLRAIARQAKADGFANMLSRVADALEEGSTSRLYLTIADRAIAAAYKPEVTEGRTKAIQMVALPKLGYDDDGHPMEVEEQAWNDLKAGHIDLYRPLDLNTMDYARSGVSKYAVMLRAIAQDMKADALANMLSRIADDMDHGISSPLKLTIAKKAIAAVSPDALQEHRVIQTKAIREFAEWFDRNDLLVESDNFPDDTYDKALDIAYKAVKDHFTVEDFLARNGSDFHYSEAGPEDGEPLEYAYVRESLIDFVGQRLEDALDGVEYPSKAEVAGLADTLMSEVVNFLTSKGYTVEGGPVGEDDFDGEVSLDVTPDDDATVLDEEDEFGMNEEAAKAAIQAHHSIYVQKMGAGDGSVYQTRKFLQSMGLKVMVIRTSELTAEPHISADINVVLFDVDSKLSGGAVDFIKNYVEDNVAAVVGMWHYVPPQIVSRCVAVSTKDLNESEELTHEDILIPSNQKDDLAREVITGDDEVSDQELQRLRTLSGVNNRETQ